MKLPNFTVSEEPSSDVTVTTSAPDALRLYAKQVAVRRPASVHQVVSGHRARIVAMDQRTKKAQPIVRWVALGGAWGFALVSIPLTVALLLLAWMVSGPIKAAILATIGLLGWWIFS